MNKKCESCGRFMSLTDYLPDEDIFDEEWALECGMTPEQIEDGDWLDPENRWSRFVYVHDQWVCENCNVTEWHMQGPRYYWNPKTNNYDSDRPVKPPTPAERAAEDARRQEAAGQLRLIP